MSRAPTIWITGIPASGKSTLAKALVDALRARSVRTELLDSDHVRPLLSGDLGFRPEDRITHLRRLGFICELLTRNGIAAVIAAVSPYRSIRGELREKLDPFVEIFAKCSIAAAMARDARGLYRKALSGEIPNFTGVSDPYEEPIQPEIIVDTEFKTEAECLERILRKLEYLGHV